MPDTPEQSQYFRIGSVEAPASTEFAEPLPGPSEDLRFVRPYFVVPFLDREETQIDADDALDDATKRIELKLANMSVPVTDVYIISHGWHRNIYGAVAAYDRLMSRFATLIRRGRITPPEDWNPLFLTLHWHSDLGKNDWVDQAGRRDKASFLRLIFERIQPRTAEIQPGDMRTAFEELFEFFVKICAPEIDPFAKGIERDSQRLGKVLEDYTIRDAWSASHEELISAVWTCYHEAEICRPVTEQDESPGEFTHPIGYLFATLKIVLAVVGVMAIAGFVLRNKWVGDRWEWVEGFLERTMVLVFPSFENLTSFAKGLVWFGLVYLFAWLVIGVVVLAYRRKRHGEPTNIEPGRMLDPRERRKRRAKGLKLSGTLAWASLQAVHALPILAYCLVSPLFASLWVQLAFVGLMIVLGLQTPWFLAVAVASLMLFIFSRYQFQERSYRVGSAPRGLGAFRLASKIVGLIRHALIRFARLPSRAVRGVASPDDRLLPIWQAVDNQFVFWDMVEKAVRSAERSSDWFHDLCRRNPKKLGSATRCHIFGHSHGGLLTMNFARLLAHQEGESLPKVQTVGTICGAFMSSWLVGELHFVNQVQGCVACMYSRYDVANSFWYPLANIGRKAAGYVGLWLGSSPPRPDLGEPLPFASLSSTPNLAKRVENVGQDPKDIKVLNIDGSRLIFDGPVVPQGAHNDIFKDEVVQILWACTQFEKDRAVFRPN